MTTEIADLKLDKSKWPAGPWHDEPDRKQWIHADLDCLIVRNHLGAWCGYVGVPKEHPAHGHDYNDEIIGNVTAHGCLTYANKCQGNICHVPEPGRPDDVWWLGFDCAHAWDFVPGMAALMTFHDGTYRDLDYVTAETNELAEKLATMNRG